MTEIFEVFQEFRKILCVCPCCGELSRVSDLRLKIKGVAGRTWLDDFELKNSVQADKEQKFEEIEEKIRAKSVEQGRKAAEKVFNQAISPAFKALKLSPFDVKPILNPVDFVVFDGMDKGNVKDIVLLSKQSMHKMLNQIREQVRTAILNNKYDWQVARIDEVGNIIFE